MHVPPSSKLHPRDPNLSRETCNTDGTSAQLPSGKPAAFAAWMCCTRSQRCPTCWQSPSKTTLSQLSESQLEQDEGRGNFGQHVEPYSDASAKPQHMSPSRPGACRDATVALLLSPQPPEQGNMHGQSLPIVRRFGPVELRVADSCNWAFAPASILRSRLLAACAGRDASRYPAASDPNPAAPGTNTKLSRP